MRKHGVREQASQVAGIERRSIPAGEIIDRLVLPMVNEDVQTLIRRSPRLLKWALMRRDPIPMWTQGRITLLGDAAHATLPFLAQGAVHSIEDGQVLSRCLEGIDAGEVPAALKRVRSRPHRANQPDGPRSHCEHGAIP